MWSYANATACKITIIFECRHSALFGRYTSWCQLTHSAATWGLHVVKAVCDAAAGGNDLGHCILQGVQEVIKGWLHMPCTHVPTIHRCSHTAGQVSLHTPWSVKTTKKLSTQEQQYLLEWYVQLYDCGHAVQQHSLQQSLMQLQACKACTIYCNTYGVATCLAWQDCGQLAFWEAHAHFVIFCLKYIVSVSWWMDGFPGAVHVPVKFGLILGGSSCQLQAGYAIFYCYFWSNRACSNRFHGAWTPAAVSHIWSGWSLFLHLK